MRTSYPLKAGSRALALKKSVRGARGKFCPLIRARVFHVFTFWFLYFLFLVSRRKDSRPEEKGKDDFTLHFKSAPLCLGKNILIHMARECVPQVSFGGVGSIVGDLARIQAVTLPDTEVFVVLPKYGFINASQHIGTFSFLRGRRRISGVLFHSYSNRINYLFVSAPSHLSRLWKSGNPNNIYNLPQGFGSRGWIERDLYFSYVTMHIVRHLHECRALNSIVNAGKLETGIVLHVHGNLNLPVTWFLKQSRMKKVSTIYTMHDYADERRWYTIRDLAVWQQLTGGELDIFYTSLAPLGSRPIKRISLLSFLHFADIITAVSHGQVKEILQRGGDVAKLLALRKSQQRFYTILNWIDISTWKRARKLVKLTATSQSKNVAKNKLCTLLSASHGAWKITEDCVVLWLARFEANKGVGILSQLYKIACSQNCTFVMSGFISSKRDEKTLEKQLKLMRKMQRHVNCPFILQTPDKNVHINKHNLLAAADIIIVPSTREAYGLAAAEALAYGTIPVVSGVGGLTEVVHPYRFLRSETKGYDDDWTGFVFPIYEGDLSSTAESASVVLVEAIQELRKVRLDRGIDSLHLRLIASTPLSEKTKSFQHYNRIVKKMWLSG